MSYASRTRIVLERKEIEYTVRRYRRSRRLRLTVNCDATVMVSVPRFVTRREIELFIRRKFHWIVEKTAYFKNHPHHWCCKGKKEEYARYRNEAHALVTRKVAEFNGYYKFSPQSISVKNQKTRWGSCSANGNLNFNYKLLFLEEALVDYVVVHELCHLAELNHSKRFWQLVQETISDYPERRALLMSKRSS